MDTTQTHRLAGAEHSNLLTCFFTECERQLRFLEQEHGFYYLSGLTRYHNGRQIIMPYQGQDYTPPFFATTRYELGDLALEVTYSDETYRLEVQVFYNRIQRLQLHEILKAAKKMVWLRDQDFIASSPRALKKCIERIQAVLHKHGDLVLTPSDRLLEKAQAIRDTLLEQNIREQYKKDMHQASTLAARAFLQKEFPRVIELLSPYERDLGAADLKKLDQARKKILLSLA